MSGIPQLRKMAKSARVRRENLRANIESRLQFLRADDVTVDDVMNAYDYESETEEAGIEQAFATFGLYF